MTKRYVLSRTETANVLEVDGERATVTLSLRDGPLKLRGLSLNELRRCGLLLYRPVQLQITVAPEEGATPEGERGGEP